MVHSNKSGQESDIKFYSTVVFDFLPLLARRPRCVVMEVVITMSEGDYRRWRTKAHQNIKKWGMQDLEQLTLAMTEELGELSQSILEYQHEDGEYGRIQEELDDLSALMIQMQKLLNSGTEVKPCE